MVLTVPSSVSVMACTRLSYSVLAQPAWISSFFRVSRPDMASLIWVSRSSYSVPFRSCIASWSRSSCSAWRARSLASTAGRVRSSSLVPASAAATHWASTSRAVLCRNSSFMAEVTAAWSSGSSRVAESLQMRLPCSKRLMHRQTYRRSPPGIHSTLRYGLPHSEHTSSPLSTYLPLCLPCSVFVLEEVLRRLDRRASSSCTRWKVARSMMAGWQSWT